MKHSSTAVLLCSLSCASCTSQTPSPQHIFANPPHTTHTSLSAQRIPTSYESAFLGRRILAHTPLATLSTTFPSDDSSLSPAENRPSGLGGMSIGLMDYIADCEDTGNPTILAIGIATTFKNVRAGSNISIAVNWVPPYPPAERIESEACAADDHVPWWRRILRRVLGTPNEDDGGSDAQPTSPDPYAFSAANLPRFSLLGYLEPIPITGDASVDDDEASALRSCFVSTHPDAKYWLPGNHIHQSSWVRMVVTQVYWIGGFGDRAYIGWIPVEEWKNVTRGEWEGVRLPGEKAGWKEWSLPASGSDGSGLEL